ncbi:MAG: NUDIX domain-containing protein [Alphaproteobacteria bacterium]|nr:NUDIX domain-containing protein [Alphaproteobacteria bacterium]
MAQFPHGVEPVVATLILNEKNEVLLAKSPKFESLWIFPGGHIDSGETIEQTAFREAQEETGLTCKKANDFHFFQEIIGSPDFHRPAHILSFAVALKTEGNVSLDKNELFEYKWVSLDEALKMNLMFAFREIILAYKRYLKND